MAIFREIINAIWQLLSIPFEFERFKFNLWQFFLFFIVIAVVLNLIFGKVESKK
jgi:hypothetical protein